MLIIMLIIMLRIIILLLIIMIMIMIIIIIMIITLTLHYEGGRVLLTEMLSPRIARQGTLCLISIGG